VLPQASSLDAKVRNFVIKPASQDAKLYERPQKVSDFVNHMAYVRRAPWTKATA
jgi:hypothetical protein